MSAQLYLYFLKNVITEVQVQKEVGGCRGMWADGCRVGV